MKQNIYITKYALSSGILEKEARIEEWEWAFKSFCKRILFILWNWIRSVLYERGCVKERRGKAAKKN